MPPREVIKRDGVRVPFDGGRIASAIARAQQAVGQADGELAAELATVVEHHLERTQDRDEIPLEAVQDAVIYVLQESGNYDAATAYTRYRDARERARRQRRLAGDEPAAPNLTLIDDDARRRPYDRQALVARLCDEIALTPKAAAETAIVVEGLLAESDQTEISARLLASLVDTALLRTGRAALAERATGLRLDRRAVARTLAEAGHGAEARCATGGRVLTTLALAQDLPPEVLRLFGQGRLWVSGLDDPRRGFEFTAALDGSPNPWQTIADAFALAVHAARSWHHINLIIPPMLLGHLERGASALIRPLEELSALAECYLYCDGRTPLLEAWPFTTKRIGIATYAEDFLLLGRLQHLGLKHLSGPHLLQGGYRRRVAVELALNAQGLEEHYSQLDHLAMALVAAARVRQRQLGNDPELAGADIRYAIYGLAPASPSNEYLERQMVQEGLRNGVALARTSRLTAEACEHLGRLFE